MRVQMRKPEELVARAKEYLALNANTRLRLADVARALRVSPALLGTAFRSVDRVPFYRYALHLRLKRAASLLGASEDLARLAVELGFASHSHFSTAFLRWAGSTPSAFRAQLREPPG
jgi:AraC family transcriptional regulator